MKEAILLIVIFACAGLGVAQSRRPAPLPAEGKVNKRPASTPTPEVRVEEPAADETTADDGSDDLIKVDTGLVSIPVRVMDRKGRFVAGLAQPSFTVSENGVEQEIAYFTNEAQPFTVALVLDMSYSTTFKIDEIQDAAIAFIGQLRPADKVLVISFDEETHILCEATTDRKLIAAAIRRTKIATGTSLYEAVALTMNERLRSVEGRKAIVLFTDGVDTTSRTSHSMQNLRDALELDALIYPIRYDTFADVQAMKNKTVVSMPGTLPGSTPPTMPENKPFPFPIPTGPMMGTPSSKGTTAEEYAAAEEYLVELAERTGGRVYVAGTLVNLAASFSKIASELREFYSIGYYPKEEVKPGDTRKIKVRVDKEGVVVRSRGTYVAPAGTAARRN